MKDAVEVLETNPGELMMRSSVPVPTVAERSFIYIHVYTAMNTL